MAAKKSVSKYIIQTRDNKGTRLYWNNQYGWGDKAGAQQFTEKQMRSLHLPVKGKWLKIK